MTALQRKWSFKASMIDDAPEHPGVYALWENDTLVRFGRTRPRGDSIRAHLRALHAFYEAQPDGRPTHYSWEVALPSRERAHA